MFMKFNNIHELKRCSFTRATTSVSAEGLAYAEFVTNESNSIDDRFEAIVYFASQYLGTNAKALDILKKNPKSYIVGMYSRSLRGL